MSAEALATSDIESASAPPLELQRGLALGFLAMTPLLAVYEIALSTSGGARRNTAEFVLSLPLLVFGAHANAARATVLLVCTLAALWVSFHARLGLLTRIARVAAEGALAALVLGPALILLQRALALPQPETLGSIGGVPGFSQAIFVASGAAFEEILFRVGLQSALYLLALQLFEFFTDSRRFARVLAEAASIVVGSLLFAAAHLAAVTHPLGSGGESFDPAVFSWRFLAGVALGLLFRWRGPGVAAWTHALFNLALFVGAGPDVFL